MTLLELKIRIDDLISNGYENLPICITVKGGIGWRAFVSPTSIYKGFDWENEQIRIDTDRKIEAQK